MNQQKNTDTTDSVVTEAGKNTAIIAYLTIIGLIIAFVMNSDKKNKYASYRIAQMLGLCLTGIVIMAINVIPVLGWIVSILGSILLLILWISGLINAVNAKESPVPILGKKYQKWFGNI